MTIERLVTTSSIGIFGKRTQIHECGVDVYQGHGVVTALSVSLKARNVNKKRKARGLVPQMPLLNAVLFAHMIPIVGSQNYYGIVFMRAFLQRIQDRAQAVVALYRRQDEPVVA